MIRPLSGATVAVCIAVISCQSLEYRENKEFLRLTSEQQRAALHKSTPEDQLGLYLIAVTYTHPSPVHLAEVIAQGGEPMLKRILDRLAHEESGLRKMHLIFAACRINDLGIYEITSDVRVLTRLFKAASEIESSNLRDVSTDLVLSLLDPTRMSKLPE